MTFIFLYSSNDKEETGVSIWLTVFILQEIQLNNFYSFFLNRHDRVWVLHYFHVNDLGGHFGF